MTGNCVVFLRTFITMNLLRCLFEFLRQGFHRTAFSTEMGFFPKVICYTFPQLFYVFWASLEENTTVWRFLLLKRLNCICLTYNCSWYANADASMFRAHFLKKSTFSVFSGISSIIWGLFSWLIGTGVPKIISETTHEKIWKTWYVQTTLC